MLMNAPQRAVEQRERSVDRQRLQELATTIRKLRVECARSSAAANELPSDPRAIDALQAGAFVAKTQLEQALNDYFDLSEALRHG